MHLFRMVSISDAITVAVIICSANHGFDRQLIPVFIFKVLDRPNEHAPSNRNCRSAASRLARPDIYKGRPAWLLPILGRES